MRISIIGTGYVGLVTGTCLAETGNEVVCMDIDIQKINLLHLGKLPIYEPGLETLFLRNKKEKRLRFTDNLKEVVQHGDLIFLALPTPPMEDGSADLSYVLDVADKIGRLIKNYKIIIDKSTVPVGTAQKVQECIAKHCMVDFDVVSNPEFLREGYAVEDFLKPDRIVIGTRSEKVKQCMNELYAPYIRQGNPIIFMDEVSAELTKYAANAFLAMKISYMNEIANLCERVGANVDMIRKGIGTDERIGKRFLFAGIGYGGSCFPKDVRALAKIASEVKYPFRIIDAVIEVNQEQRLAFFKRIEAFFQNDIRGKVFGLWGLSFKPNTDDIRDAPALDIIRNLIKAGAKVQAYDPEAMKNVQQVFEGESALRLEEGMYEAIRGVDALIIATEWNEFRNLNWDKMSEYMMQKCIFDGRNLFEPHQVKEKGFYYESIGR